MIKSAKLSGAISLVQNHIPSELRALFGAQREQDSGPFQAGEFIDCKSPKIFGYGLTPQGWKVVGHTPQGQYKIRTPQGDNLVHDASNIELHFRRADPNAKPFNPKRFERSSAV